MLTGLARSNAKKAGIEFVYSVQKPAVASVDLSLRFGIGIIVAVDVPTIWRHLANGIDAATEKRPKFFGVVGAARKA